MEIETVIGDEEKPVAAVGDVSGDVADWDCFGFAIGGDVADADAMIGMEGGGDDADGGLDAMGADGDASEVMQGGDEADHAVAAHAEQADVVEKGDTGGAAGVGGFGEQGSDDDFVTARLANEGAAIAGQLFRGEAAEHDAGGLTAGVGVDDGDACHGAGMMAFDERSLI